MKNKSNKRYCRNIFTALSLAGALSTVAYGQTKPLETGYLVDQRGIAVRSGSGLCWHTGTGPASATPNECDSGPATAPITKATEPVAKVPMVLAPKPAAARVTLDADALFDFNKSNLLPAGRDALDTFVASIHDISPEAILAVGHADRFGSDSYNQHLSEQRAESVKTYLMSKGIDPNRIKIEGRGETQPTTQTSECQGAKSSKTIACLQPDRRVDVQIVGTRISQ
ncbi:MAG TPA: OmpA family protein [Rhodocyclaceae bacterium]|jgi:OOP family OmpA-OmpF porin